VFYSLLNKFPSGYILELFRHEGEEGGEDGREGEEIMMVMMICLNQKLCQNVLATKDI